MLGRFDKVDLISIRKPIEIVPLFSQIQNAISMGMEESA
jgi:hypothetical protein